MLLLAAFLVIGLFLLEVGGGAFFLLLVFVAVAVAVAVFAVGVESPMPIRAIRLGCLAFFLLLEARDILRSSNCQLSRFYFIFLSWSSAAVGSPCFLSRKPFFMSFVIWYLNLHINTSR